MKNTSAKRLTGTGFLVCALLLGFSITSTAQTFHPVDITNVKVESVKCKFFRWSVRFKVPKTANGGWIVQEMKWRLSIQSCETPPKNGMNSWGTYYEAWPVGANQDTTTDSWGNPSNPPGMNHNDTYSITIPPNTKGKASWQGTIIFIENPPGGSALDTTWKKPGVPMAGGLTSTLTTPAFWAAALASGKAKKHNCYVEWDCCNVKDTLIYDTAVTAPVVTFPATTFPTDTIRNQADTTIKWGNPEIFFTDPVVTDTTVVTDSIPTPTDSIPVPTDTTDAIGPMRVILNVMGNKFNANDHSALTAYVKPARAKHSTLRAYPVPATNTVLLDYGATLNKDVTIRIMNLSGQLIRQQDMHLVQKVELDIRELPKGIYLVLVNSKDGTYSGNCKIAK